MASALLSPSCVGGWQRRHWHCPSKEWKEEEQEEEAKTNFHNAVSCVQWQKKKKEVQNRLSVQVASGSMSQRET